EPDMSQGQSLGHVPFTGAEAAEQRILRPHLADRATSGGCRRTGPERPRSAAGSTRPGGRPASVFDFARVEGALDELDDLFFRRRVLVLLALRLSFRTFGERHHESAPRDLVEGVAEERRVLRERRLLTVERGGRRKLERQRVAVELRRVGL